MLKGKILESIIQTPLMEDEKEVKFEVKKTISVERERN